MHFRSLVKILARWKFLFVHTLFSSLFESLTKAFLFYHDKFPLVVFINWCCFICVVNLNVILLKPPSEVKISIKFSCPRDRVLAVHFMNLIQVVNHGAAHQSINQINFYLQSP